MKQFWFKAHLLQSKQHIERLILLASFLFLVVYGFSVQPEKVKAIEIGKHNVDLLVQIDLLKNKD